MNWSKFLIMTILCLLIGAGFYFVLGVVLYKYHILNDLEYKKFQMTEEYYECTDKLIKKLLSSGINIDEYASEEYTQYLESKTRLEYTTENIQPENND